MIRVFYTLEKTDSEAFIRRILAEYYHLFDPHFVRTDYGKPFLEDNPLYFNLSHSGGMTVLAVSDREVGIDCERIRNRRYASVLRSFSAREQEEIISLEEFLRHWTVKESFVKFLGTALAKELPVLEYAEGTLYLDGQKQDVSLVTNRIDAYFVTVCSLGQTEPEYLCV